MLWRGHLKSDFWKDFHRPMSFLLPTLAGMLSIKTFISARVKKSENEFSNYFKSLPKTNFSGLWIHWWKIKLPHVVGNWHQGMWKFTHWISTTIWAWLVNEIEKELWFSELNQWSSSSVPPVVLNNGPLKVSHPNPWNLWIFTFHGKRVFANVIKNFEVRRLSWIILGSPKYNHMCLYKRGRGRPDGHVRGESNGAQRRRDWRGMVTAKECHHTSEAWGGKEQILS